MNTKIINKLFIGGALLLATSCNENNPYLFGAKDAFVDAKASAANDAIFTPNAQTGEGVVESNAPWEVKSLTEWITCTTTSGEHNGKLLFQLSENKGANRVGKIVVYNTIGTQMTDTLTITQQCALQYLPENLTMDIQSKALASELDGQKLAQVNFEVAANTPWRVYTKTTDGWSTVLTKKGATSGTGSLVVAKNDALTKRSMYVYVQSINYPSVKDSVLVSQAGRPVEINVLSPTNGKMLLDEEQSKFVISIKGDGKWRLTNVPSWLTISGTEFEGTANIVATVSSTTAARSAQLEIHSLIQPDKVKMLNIDQKIIPSGRLKDSLALVAIYNATHGERWTYNWKFELPLSETNWPGIFVDVVGGELRVVDLSLMSFNLEGTLPNELGWLSAMTKLKVQRNKLEGPLPASVNRLTNLTHMYLSNNNFSGEFPDISALQKLSTFESDFTRFEGEFPASFNLLPKLSIVKFKYNKLNPTTLVPKKFGGWKLTYINPQRAVYGDATSDYKLVDIK